MKLNCMIQIMWLRFAKMGHRPWWRMHSDLLLCVSSGMKTLLKKYEAPKPEEVNIYKQKLERIHAGFASSSK